MDCSICTRISQGIAVPACLWGMICAMLQMETKNQDQKFNNRREDCSKQYAEARFMYNVLIYAARLCTVTKCGQIDACKLRENQIINKDIYKQNMNPMEKRTKINHDYGTFNYDY